MTPSMDETGAGIAERGPMHTTEPWVADIPYIHAGDDETNIAECFEDPQRNDDDARDEMWANVRRIVACVNACAGLTAAQLNLWAEGVRDTERIIGEQDARLAALVTANAELINLLGGALAGYHGLSNHEGISVECGDQFCGRVNAALRQAREVTP